MADHGVFYWNELITGDVATAKDFYGKTLGWTFEDMPMTNGSYTLIKLGDKMVGGILKKTAEMGEMPDHWFTYVSVDDVDKRLAGVAKAGGKVMREPFDVPGVGRIGIVVDATGAAQGWMTAAG